MARLALLVLTLLGVCSAIRMKTQAPDSSEGTAVFPTKTKLESQGYSSDDIDFVDGVKKEQTGLPLAEGNEEHNVIRKIADGIGNTFVDSDAAAAAGMTPNGMQKYEERVEERRRKNDPDIFERMRDAADTIFPERELATEHKDSNHPSRGTWVDEWGNELRHKPAHAKHRQDDQLTPAGVLDNVIKTAGNALPAIFGRHNEHLDEMLNSTTDLVNMSHPPHFDAFNQPEPFGHNEENKALKSDNFWNATAKTLMDELKEVPAQLIKKFVHKEPHHERKWHELDVKTQRQKQYTMKRLEHMNWVDQYMKKEEDKYDRRHSLRFETKQQEAEERANRRVEEQSKRTVLRAQKRLNDNNREKGKRRKHEQQAELMTSVQDLGDNMRDLSDAVLADHTWEDPMSDWESGYELDEDYDIDY